MTWDDGDDGTVVTVSGEIDVSSVRVLEQEIARRRPFARPLSLDLAGVTFFDSSGVRAVLAARRAAIDDTGVAVRVVAASRIVRKVLEVAGVAEPLLGAAPRGDESG